MILRLLSCLLFCLVACAPSAAQTDTIDTELSRVNEQIAAAEAENAKYSGGLVKSLIVAQVETLKQTRAMLEQRKTARTIDTTVRYTIDGKPFAIDPAVRTQLLPAIEREVDANRLKIAAAENEVSK